MLRAPEDMLDKTEKHEFRSPPNQMFDMAHVRVRLPAARKPSGRRIISRLGQKFPSRFRHSGNLSEHDTNSPARCPLLLTLAAANKPVAARRCAGACEPAARACGRGGPWLAKPAWGLPARRVDFRPGAGGRTGESLREPWPATGTSALRRRSVLAAKSPWPAGLWKRCRGLRLRATGFSSCRAVDAFHGRGPPRGAAARFR